jgi:hypothetical protein
LAVSCVSKGKRGCPRFALCRTALVLSGGCRYLVKQNTVLRRLRDIVQAD